MSSATQNEWSGGCQCGAIRFRVGKLGRASMCHCRMCQKASGSVGGAFVTAMDIIWTRGALAHFQSSNNVRRGFCRDCGTPLSFEYKTYIDLSIAAFDRAAEIAPVIQMEHDQRLPWLDTLTTLPLHPEAEREAVAKRLAAVVTFQHPDHDTDIWPPARVHQS